MLGLRGITIISKVLFYQIKTILSLRRQKQVIRLSFSLLSKGGQGATVVNVSAMASEYLSGPPTHTSETDRAESRDDSDKFPTICGSLQRNLKLVFRWLTNS
ncbi:hypothetical protein O6H91_23G026800 [Diphasiastrum complanatum]|uniref:Uncharacterized protein n=1 Tax=Diphasiastrum complanatum TaxID=34168 RepID=A0ACC2A9A6_DIPCM|nr:hypothetical protein O6H91_23G026800 [Diphasiastrum complanatum]